MFNKSVLTLLNVAPISDPLLLFISINRINKHDSIM
jgi:hypothetical protein